MINVTKTFLPPIDEFNAILKRAWDLQWLTNRGILVKELENKLKDILKVNYITLTGNGTIPLQIAIKALGLKGEIITTPFSYVATTAVISWENCTPVFVDIHPEYLTIDESKIENAITSNTTAILATHVFGNPCHVIEIEKIAIKHNLKVIYDGAHCFGVEHNNKSIFNYGDVSTCSFHATKLFHTAEGGAMFSNTAELHDRLFFHHNFGHKGQNDFHGMGINGKMSELSGAMGLALIPHIGTIMKSREETINNYITLLQNADIRFLKIRENTKWNYSYFPVIFNDESALLNAVAKLNAENIFPRRYFYPSLSGLNYVNDQSTPVGDKISSTILCLPLYHDLKKEEIEKIAKIVKSI